LPQQLRRGHPTFRLQGNRLKTLAGVQVRHPVGLKAVVVRSRVVVMVVVVDHQTMLKRLCQRLHLSLQLQRCPACHRLAKHGQQQEKNRGAFHGAAQYTFGPISRGCVPTPKPRSRFQAGAMVVGA
jgi:hypothetical protein